ncbi:MAG: hypothetical protein L0Y64_18080 [Myxococcaceae bacterium]|nr:hypothetical protein [Myxococcaceae bacterium]
MTKVPRSVGFPISGVESRIEYEGSLFQDFLDIFVLPLRKRIAEEQFVADTLKVALAALHVASEVSKAFAYVQAAERHVEMRRMVVEAALAGAELTDRLYEAGNVNALKVRDRLTSYEDPGWYDNPPGTLASSAEPP